MTPFSWYIYTAIAIITESFPISSSGHIALFNSLINIHNSADFISAYDHLLHGPIAVCVALFFYPRWRFLLHPWRARSIILKLMLLGFATEAITTIGYFVLSKLSVVWFPLWLGFCITACALFSLRYCSGLTSRHFDLQTAVVLGCIQAFALLPGISRFGTTFVCARWLGFSGQQAFELSFLLLMPLATAGFAKGLLAVRSDTAILQLLNLKMLLVILGACVAFYYGLRCVQKLIASNNLWYVSLYVALVSLFALVV